MAPRERWNSRPETCSPPGRTSPIRPRTPVNPTSSSIASISSSSAADLELLLKHTDAAQDVGVQAVLAPQVGAQRFAGTVIDVDAARRHRACELRVLDGGFRGVVQVLHYLRRRLLWRHEEVPD